MKKIHFFRRFLILTCILALLLPGAALAVDTPEVEATAALLVDAENNTVLYELNATEKRYPASITKIMTALLTLEAVDRGELTLDQMITAPSWIYDDLESGSSTQDIQSGEELSVLDLLYCTMLPSACEACNVLAYAVSGSIESFVELMNERAQELGMEDTHYVNTHGLHDDDHYTTAWDIWLLAKQAMENETFREIVATAEYTVAATNLSDERTFYNTNALITNMYYSGYLYSSAIGIKTGSTSQAGYCLVSAAEEDGRTLYCVVLGAELSPQEDGSYKRMNFAETITLLDWGFDNFSYTTLLDSDEPVTEVAVTLSDTDYVLVYPEGSLSALVANDLDIESLTQTVELYAESVEAPVSQGQVLGQLTLSYVDEDTGEETVYGSVDLVALNDVERSQLLYLIDRGQKLISKTWFKVAVVLFLVLVVVLIFLISTRRRRKRNRSRSYSYSGGRRRSRRR
ncbi:MAG: D-alanyl-D-alanine carboxypeptidase [Oscillospiraceae bacterium]|nr:D-alanyl-D-alanine carboxypeptidase [Oscillospiraceae bacterium]